MSTKNFGLWTSLASLALFACSAPPPAAVSGSSESSVRTVHAKLPARTSGAGSVAPGVGRPPTTKAANAVQFGASDAPSGNPTGASASPGGVADPGGSTAGSPGNGTTGSSGTSTTGSPGTSTPGSPGTSPTPSSSATSGTASPTPSPTATASLAPVATSSPGVGASPPAFSHVRNLVPGIVTETDSTTQMGVVTVNAGQALLIPDGKTIAVFNTMGVKVAPYDLATLLTLTVNNVQAIAVSGLKVYAVGNLGGQPSLITVTVDGNTLAPSATSVPLKGVSTKTIGGLVLKNATTLIAADTGNSVLDTIAIADGTVANFAGTSGVTGTTVGGANADMHFNHPTALALTGTTLYCMDAGNSRVVAGDLTQGTFTTLLGGTPGSADGAFASAQISTSNGMALDGQKLYIADTGNNTVRIAALDTKLISTITVVQPGPAGLLPFGRGIGVLTGLIYGSDNAGDLFSFKASL
jgi:sugar lactone lactonase YvrE